LGLISDNVRLLVLLAAVVNMASAFKAGAAFSQLQKLAIAPWSVQFRAGWAAGNKLYGGAPDKLIEWLSKKLPKGNPLGDQETFMPYDIMSYVGHGAGGKFSQLGAWSTPGGSTPIPVGLSYQQRIAAATEETARNTRDNGAGGGSGGGTGFVVPLLMGYMW
jgi:hypothetical protein